MLSLHDEQSAEHALLDLRHGVLVIGRREQVYYQAPPSCDPRRIAPLVYYGDSISICDHTIQMRWRQTYCVMDRRVLIHDRALRR